MSEAALQNCYYQVLQQFWLLLLPRHSSNRQCVEGKNIGMEYDWRAPQAS